MRIGQIEKCMGKCFIARVVGGFIFFLKIAFLFSSYSKNQAALKHEGGLKYRDAFHINASAADGVI